MKTPECCHRPSYKNSWKLLAINYFCQRLHQYGLNHFVEMFFQVILKYCTKWWSSCIWNDMGVVKVKKFLWLTYYFWSIALEFFWYFKNRWEELNSFKSFFFVEKRLQGKLISAVTILTAGFYLLKARNVRKICSTLVIKRPEWYQWCYFVSLLLTLNRFHTLFWCFHYWLWTSKCQLGFV